MTDATEMDLETKVRRAMASYKHAALVFKAEGNETLFKTYRKSWCVLEALCPVDPSEYW